MNDISYRGYQEVERKVPPETVLRRAIDHYEAWRDERPVSRFREIAGLR